MRKRILLIVIMAVLSMAWSVRAVSQSTVKGVVVDSETNEPIVGATVTLQGTKNVVFTDDNGRFTLKSPKTKAILQFTCVGYENLMLPINETSAKSPYKIVQSVLFLGLDNFVWKIP